MTWRLVSVLMARLPQESHYKSDLRDSMTLEQWNQAPKTPDRWGQWSQEGLLLASVIDRLAMLQWTLVAVNTDKKKSPPKQPEPLPRPGVGAGPLGALADKERRDSLLMVAVLRAKERNQGGEPTDEQVQAVLDEMTGGGDV